MPREVIQVLLNDQIKDYTGRPTGVTADDIYDYLDLVNGRPGSYDPGDAVIEGKFDQIYQAVQTGQYTVKDLRLLPPM